MASVRIKPITPAGKIEAQPSKSMAHRAILSAALANGVSLIDNVILSDDITATLEAIVALGANATVSESIDFPGKKKIEINSSGRIIIAKKVIDCHESGSTARFIIPVSRLSADTVTVTGRNRLIERPFTVYKELFVSKGIKYEDRDGKMPITLTGRLIPGYYAIPGDISSQFISGLLFALPLLEDASHIEITKKLESLPYIQMTIQVLNEFGIEIHHDPDYLNFHIPGKQKYRAMPFYKVEGDWSQAAFFCVMGALSGQVEMEGLNTESLQGDKVILDILERMGAKYEILENRIRFYKSELHGIDIDVSQCPDLVPAIAVAASLAHGTTRITNAARLRIKESDRLTTTCRELNNLGAHISEKTDGLVIEGVKALKGGKADGSGDHRIVMALAAASAVCGNTVDISGSDAVKKSYPDFWKDFETLGGKVEFYE